MLALYGRLHLELSHLADAQLLVCWAQALLSEKRSLSTLCPGSVPKASDIVFVLQILQHNLLQSGKISLQDVLSTAQRRRLAGDGHHGTQGTGSSSSKGMVEGGTLSQ